MPPVFVLNLTGVRPARFGGLVAVCAVVALLVAMAAPSRADAARVQCAGTFRILHDDHVGLPPQWPAAPVSGLSR
jgi:hypothetical protein